MGVAIKARSPLDNPQRLREALRKSLLALTSGVAVDWQVLRQFEVAHDLAWGEAEALIAGDPDLFWGALPKSLRIDITTRATAYARLGYSSERISQLCLCPVSVAQFLKDQSR